jgi:MFS-type transporter involved in bile tolerance (Atg22 family)
LSKKISSQKNPEMAIRKLLLVAHLLISLGAIAQSKAQLDSSINHSYMFNNSLSWLMHATASDIQKILSEKGFCHVALINEGKLEVVYNADYHFQVTQQQINRIQTYIYNNYSYLEQFMQHKPEVEFFQWSDYLERTEIWSKGPVFVFKNSQLTHILLTLK